MARRVVITGMGAITPLGNTVDEFWAGLKRGKTAVAPITKFDTEATNCAIHLAAEVKDFDPSKYMDFKTAKRMELFSQYAVAAATDAVEDAGLDMSKEDPFRVGVIVSSGVGSMQAHEREQVKMHEGKKCGPLYIPMMISNMASANIAIKYGMKGKNTCIVTACATGTNSIGDAFKSVKYDEADVMVAGGCEAAVCMSSIKGFGALTALSTNPDPETASRPFDKDRDGFVSGEGAGVMILEELEHAKARGAKIYAEVVGYGATCDAYHITSPAEDGSGAGTAMIIAMKEAGIEPKDVDYINAHGTSTSVGDLSELRAVKSIFGDAPKNCCMSSTKSMTGHLLGAAGAIEAVITVMSIKDQICPPTINLQNPEDEVGDFNLVPGTAQKHDIEYAMSNNFGFGGTNGSLLFKRMN